MCSLHVCLREKKGRNPSVYLPTLYSKYLLHFFVMCKLFALSHWVIVTFLFTVVNGIFLLFSFILKLFLVMNRNSSACCGSRTESSLDNHPYCKITSLETLRRIGLLQCHMEMNSGCVGAGMWRLNGLFAWRQDVF